jgi:hypothetical protein
MLRKQIKGVEDKVVLARQINELRGFAFTVNVLKLSKKQRIALTPLNEISTSYETAKTWNLPILRPGCVTSDRKL